MSDETGASGEGCRGLFYFIGYAFGFLFVVAVLGLLIFWIVNL